MDNELLVRLSDLKNYFSKMIVSSEKNAKGLRSMKEKGFTQEGMIEKCIEVTAIQSEQIRMLAMIALYVVKSDKFASDMAISMVMEHEEKNSNH